jgi:hypothetical protein
MKKLSYRQAVEDADIAHERRTASLLDVPPTMHERQASLDELGAVLRGSQPQGASYVAVTLPDGVRRFGWRVRAGTDEDHVQLDELTTIRVPKSAVHVLADATQEPGTAPDVVAAARTVLAPRRADLRLTSAVTKISHDEISMGLAFTASRGTPSEDDVRQVVAEALGEDWGILDGTEDYPGYLSLRLRRNQDLSKAAQTQTMPGYAVRPGTATDNNSEVTEPEVTVPNVATSQMHRPKSVKEIAGALLSGAQANHGNAQRLMNEAVSLYFKASPPNLSNGSFDMNALMIGALPTVAKTDARLWKEISNYVATQAPKRVELTEANQPGMRATGPQGFASRAPGTGAAKQPAQAAPQGTQTQVNIGQMMRGAALRMNVQAQKVPEMPAVVSGITQANNDGKDQRPIPAMKEVIDNFKAGEAEARGSLVSFEVTWKKSDFAASLDDHTVKHFVRTFAIMHSNKLARGNYGGLKIDEFSRDGAKAKVSMQVQDVSRVPAVTVVKQAQAAAPKAEPEAKPAEEKEAPRGLIPGDVFRIGGTGQRWVVQRANGSILTVVKFGAKRKWFSASYNPETMAVKIKGSDGKVLSSGHAVLT